MWKLLFLSNPNTSSISGRRVGEDALESPRGECATSPFQKVESSERRRCGSVHVSTTSFLEAREPRDSGSSKHKWTTRNMFKRKFSFLVFLSHSHTSTPLRVESWGWAGAAAFGRSLCKLAGPTEEVTAARREICESEDFLSFYSFVFFYSILVFTFSLNMTSRTTNLYHFFTIQS